MSSVKLKLLNLVDSKTSEESLKIENLEVSDKNMAYVLNWQLSKRRSGSAKIKQMSEISGTTAKPYKQKGTGHARQGSKRSVQFVGGRTCFGPTPRSFEYSLPKKIAKKGVSDALKLKTQSGNLLLVEDLYVKKASTAVFSKLLKANNIESALFLYDADNELASNIAKSVRNIKDVKSLAIKSINVYDLLKYQYVIADKLLIDNVKKIIS